MGRCEDCGEELPPEFCDTPRKSCPHCKPMARVHERKVQDGLGTSDDAHWNQDRPGVQSMAQLTDQGNITQTVTGPSPQNEEDALEICARLVRVLNSLGDTWSAPVEGEQDIDTYSINASGKSIKMQVVRASNDGRMWREINETGSATVAYDTTAAASVLIDSICKKAAKYPAVQKKEMTLVLDTARTPSHTFQQVFDVFRAQYLKECQQAGFEQVWVVGPNDDLVQRLDQ